MGQGTIKRQVIVEGNQVAFEAGALVTIESIQPNPQNPAFKYVVFSSRLQKRFQLSDNDIELIREQQQPYPPQVPVTTKVATTTNRRFSRKKIITISVAIVVIIVVAVVATVVLTGGNSSTTSSNSTTESNTATSTTNTTAAEKQLVLKTVGYAPAADLSLNHYYYVGGILHNPNNEAAVYTTVTVAGYTASGTVISSNEVVISYIGPQQDMGFASSIDSGQGSPARVVATTSVNQWLSGYAAISPCNFANTSFLGNKCTGTMTSNLSHGVTNVVVTAVLLDQAGNALTGRSTVVNNIPAGQSAPFDMQLYTSVTPATVSYYGDVPASQ